MNTRRKFLLQSGMATTGLLIADPFKNFANTVSSLTGFTIHENKQVVLLHTGHNFNDAGSANISSSLRNISGKTVLLHAGSPNGSGTVVNNYHASIHENFTGTSYKIIYRNDIKIAIVNINKAEAGLQNDLNNLCTYLKKEKNCQLVVCLSQLGYNNGTGMDDRKLAQQSKQLDVIVGAHPSNYPKHPMVAQNSNQEEVIIHSADSNVFGLGNIEFGFDKNKNKHAVAFNNRVMHQQVI